jgi:hypothetical protein
MQQRVVSWTGEALLRRRGRELEKLAETGASAVRTPVSVPALVARLSILAMHPEGA